MATHKTCPRCKTSRPLSYFNKASRMKDGRWNTCNPCIKMKKYKMNARAEVKKAIKSGELIRPKLCPICNRGSYIDAHHEDYSKPLNIFWICRSCHLRIHNGNSEKSDKVKAAFQKLIDKIGEVT